jgi:hypothetical protein
MTDNTLQTITIKRIKEQSFQINEALFSDTSRFVKIEIGQKLSFAIESNLVSLTIRMYYHYPDDSDSPIIAEINVQNVYEISDLNRFYIGQNEIKLPKETIISIVGVSISHTRSLLAKNLLGTTLQDNLPAIVNPEHVARFFFPGMFESETSMQTITNEAE